MYKALQITLRRQPFQYGPLKPWIDKIWRPGEVEPLSVVRVDVLIEALACGMLAI